MKEVEGPFISKTGINLEVGDTLSLGFGSKADNGFSFVFIQIGKMAATAGPAPAGWANTEVVVNKIIAPKRSPDSKVPLCVPTRKSLPKQAWIWLDFDNALAKKEIIH